MLRANRFPRIVLRIARATKRLTHVRERKLAVPPFSIIPTLGLEFEDCQG